MDLDRLRSGTPHALALRSAITGCASYQLFWFLSGLAGVEETDAWSRIARERTAAKGGTAKSTVS